MSNALTIKYRDFWRNNPSIASQLPIEFTAEKISWHRITITCGICHKDIVENHTHGTVTSLIPGVITVEAVSCCVDCLKLYHNIFRFRSDGAIEWVNDEGKWCHTYGKTITWWSKLIDRLKRLKPLWENLI